MLCSKCYEDIPRGKEIQIEGTIICKKCVLDSLAKKEVIDRCNRCFKLIYKDEIIHEVYENWGTESSEKLIKCQHCYKEWLKVAKLKRKRWELMRWFDNTFLPFNMWFVLAAITINKNKENVGWGHILIIFTLSTSITLLSPLFLDFIVFIYIKILERKYRKLRKKRRNLEQKVASLTRKLQEKLISVVKDYWKNNQNENEKINERTITEILGENWENSLKDKKNEEDILIEKDRLIKKIDDAKLAK